MKKMRVLMLATLMGAAVSGQAFADDTSGQSGTMTFNATLQEGTCQLSGQNIDHNFGSLSKAMTLGPGWGNGTSWGVLVQYADTITVSNCPSSVVSVKMTPTYTKMSGQTDVIDNSATNGSNVKMFISKDTELKDANTYKSGTVYSYNVNDGSVSIPMYSSVTKSKTTAITAGAADFNVQLAFAYQ
ncbi:TPA: fimbrial protein [Escherichia coli]